MCKRYLDKKEQEKDLIDEDMSMFDESDDEGDPFTQEDALKVFACQHSYHLRCVRKHYKKRTAPADFEALFTPQGATRLRCPQCNIANFDFGENAPKSNRRINAGGRAKDEMQSYREQEEKRAMRRATVRETMA